MSDEDPREYEPNAPPLGYWLPSAVCGYVVGVAVPAMLLLWHTHFLNPNRLLEADPQGLGSDALIATLTMQTVVACFCGPFAIGLSIFLNSYLRVFFWDSRTDGRKMLLYGMIGGVGLAFLNLAEYLGLSFLEWSRPYELCRFLGLMVVTGTTTGWWIALLAYKRKPSDGKLPGLWRAVLVVLVIFWSVLIYAWRP